MADWFLKDKKLKSAPTDAIDVKAASELWQQCRKCETSFTAEAWDETQHVCGECGFHMYVSPGDRLKYLLDAGSFGELDGALRSVDILSFTDTAAYSARIEKAEKTTASLSAIVTGKGAIEGTAVAVGVMNFKFLGGSLGSVVGEKIVRLVETAVKERLPLIIFSSSGGARMQEGLFSLMQMSKTSAALGRLRQAGLLYISVLTHPTTGGTTASFASLGDIIVAEPGALVGFAGPRVIEQTIRQRLPEGFQTSEFLMEKGFVDTICPRGQLRSTIHILLNHLHREGP